MYSFYYQYYLSWGAPSTRGARGNCPLGTPINPPLTAGIPFKPEKFFKFSGREVTVIGYHLGCEVYKHTKERLGAIHDFSVPEKPSITGIRSWYGFVNQLAPFHATTPIMKSFRALLKKQANKMSTEMINSITSFNKHKKSYVNQPRMAWLIMTRPSAILRMPIS